MAIRRRLTAFISVPLLLAFSIVLTPVTASAQGFAPAGNYAHTGMLGSFNFFDPTTSTNVFVFANRQRTVGPAGTTDETTLSLSASANFGTLNVNCFLDDNSSDFNVAPDLSSASLHKTIAMDNPGCGGSLASDITIDVSWTGAGPIQSTHTTSRFVCSRYTDESQGNDSNNAGPATFNMTGLDGPVAATDPQVFHFGSFLEHVQGSVPPDSCHGGVGRGAGRPTPAAGNYHTTFQDASEFSFSGGNFFFLDANTSTNTSNPLVGSSSSSSETELNFFGGAIGGCFVISAGDFTLGASSASVHVSLTNTTPACGGGTNFVDPDPFPVDATWVGTSPVATTRIDSQYSCLNYRFQTNTVQSVDSVATLTVSMPGFSATFPDASLGSIDTRTHADGTAAAGCTFRG